MGAAAKGRIEMETQNETDAKRMVLRVTSFGTLSIVCLEPQIGHTGISNENEVPVSSDKAQGRGTAPALTVLKVLLCQPSRFASRDLLMETLWPDYSRGKAQARLDDTASVLRTLLRAICGSRENLLPSVHSSKESGNGYHLAPYPLVWVDMDAFLWNAEQAARMERFGDDPLPYWERAYALASRGTFLADEPYSEWTHEHRKLLTGQYRQCVHQLARLYRERGGQTQAEQVLRAYVVSHRDDEDALRPLMELLGAQERYQEALEHYEDMKQALVLDGREPDARTRDIAEYVRAKHIKRERAANALALWLAEPRRQLQQHALHTTLPQIAGQEPFPRPSLWQHTSDQRESLLILIAQQATAPSGQLTDEQVEAINALSALPLIPGQWTILLLPMSLFVSAQKRRALLRKESIPSWHAHSTCCIWLVQCINGRMKRYKPMSCNHYQILCHNANQVSSHEDKPSLFYWACQGPSSAFLYSTHCSLWLMRSCLFAQRISPFVGS